MSRMKHQMIYLTGSDEQSSFPVDEEDLMIHASTNSTESRVVEASNKVKINPIVRFDWDKRAYFGRVIAVHKNGQFVAYSLKPATSPGGGAVRVIHLASAIKHLMKGFNGRVVDLDFACRDIPTLACVDENGLIMVYTIHLTENNLEAKRILQVVPHHAFARNSEFRRVRWCPYIPGPESEGSSWLESLLAASHGAKLELFDVDYLSRQHGSATIKSEMLKQGYLTIEEHTKAITEVAPSPDGFAIATASLDGSVNFYELPEQLQVHFVINRMYRWIPHNGNPVNTLIFLDDRRPGHKTNLWCNALTGTLESRELCIWSCDRWEVIQRISMCGPADASPDDQTSRPGQFFVRADLSGRLIVVSDVTRSVLYVLELEGLGGSDSPVHCRGVHEFVLASACLDLAVIHVRRSEGDSGDGRDIPGSAVEIEASGIYPKSLQSLQIRFNSVLPSALARSSQPKSLSNGDAAELEDLASSLTGVSPVSSMLTGLGTPGVAPSVPAFPLHDSEPAENNSKSSNASVTGSAPDVEMETNESEIGEDTVVVAAIVSGSGDHQTDREEWPAAPDIPLGDVVSSLTTTSSSVGGSGSGGGGSSGGGAPNVAVVAPHEANNASLEGDVLSLGRLDLRSPEGVCTLSDGTPTLRSNSEARGEEEREEEEEEEEEGVDDEPEIVELIEGLDIADDDDTPGADAEEEEDEDDVPALDEEEDEAGTTENGGYQEDDEDDDNDGEGSEEAREQPLSPSLSPPVPMCPVSVTAMTSSGGPNLPTSSSLILHEAAAQPPPWANALLVQMQRQSEQLSSLQHQLNEERQQREQMLEVIRCLEADLSHVSEGTSANASNARAQASASNDAMVSQFGALRLFVDQKMNDSHRALLAQQEQLFKRMISEMSPKIFHSLLSNVNAMLTNEISSVVIPNVRKNVEETRVHLNATLQEKLVAIDAVIREHINKVFKHKATVDMIGRSTADSLRRSVTGAVEEQTRSQLMPEINSALHHNASRLRDLLRKSIEELQNGITAQGSQSEQERRDHLDSVLQENKRAIDKQLTTSLRHLETSLEGHMSRLSQEVGSTMANVSAEVRTAVANVPTSFPSVAGDVTAAGASSDPHRSGAATPQLPELTTQMLRKQMMQHLANEQYVHALHEVLTYKRPELLTEMCRLVAPSQIFNNELPQNVVLSLLSQLTNTITKDTETKIKYIMETIVHLDKNDPAYRTYGPQTLVVLKKKVESFLREHRFAPCHTEMRFLMMALTERGF